MTTITIPPEAVEAAAMQLPGMASFPHFVEAAIRAALEAWPNVERIYRSEDERLFTILLPLPTEDTNAEA